MVGLFNGGGCDQSYGTDFALKLASEFGAGGLTYALERAATPCSNFPLLHTTQPSDCQIGGMTTCCAHSDCQADQYCFDTGYFSTAVWNAVGECSHNPPDCCASGDADPIDRDPAQCPAVSACS